MGLLGRRLASTNKTIKIATNEIVKMPELTCGKVLPITVREKVGFNREVEVELPRLKQTNSPAIKNGLPLILIFLKCYPDGNPFHQYRLADNKLVISHSPSPTA